MCGIVGYIGNKNATPVLIKALKKLEYRGYDSAGIAVYTADEIVVRKVKGALKNLGEKITGETVKASRTDPEYEKQEMAIYDKTADFIKGNVGIGHTRWATHGEPSDTNSHPHTNMDGTISIVHNGIIENYAELKAKLQAEGVVFQSQTDTEVVVHLIDKAYREENDIFKAVLKVIHLLEGSYALGVVCKDYPDRIICCRKVSPLVVGLGKDENFIASDVPALLEHTRDVYYLGEKELAVLYADHVDLFNFEGEKMKQALAGYDFIINTKYAALHDFLGRHTTTKANALVLPGATDSTAWTLVGIGAVTIAASASLLFFRRKKSN